MEPIFGCNMRSEKVFWRCDGCAYIKGCGNAFKIKIGSVGRHIIDHRDNKVVVRLDGEIGAFSKYDFETTYKILKNNANKPSYELLDLLREEEKPSCYTPNDGVYPLCKGNKNPIHDCKHCCLYENMTEPWD